MQLPANFDYIDSRYVAVQHELKAGLFVQLPANFDYIDSRYVAMQHAPKAGLWCHIAL